MYNKYFPCFNTHISVKLMSFTLLMSSWINQCREITSATVVSWFVFERNWLNESLWSKKNDNSAIFQIKVHWLQDTRESGWILFWHYEWQLIVTNNLTSHKCESFFLSLHVSKRPTPNIRLRHTVYTFPGHRGYAIF